MYELNYESARLAKEACVEVTAKDPSKPRFVMGSIGPTNRTGSISPASYLSLGLLGRIYALGGYFMTVLGHRLSLAVEIKTIIGL